MPPPLSNEWIDRLFIRFNQMFGNKFTTQIAADIAGTKKAWSDGLAGFSGAEIARGLTASLDVAWPPSLPEFRAMCRPKRDPEVEFRRAANILGKDPVDWKGDAVLYWTVRDVTPYDVRTLPYHAIKRRWDAALLEFENETNLPAPPEPLFSLPILPADRATSKRGIDALKAIVGMPVGLSS